MSPRTSPRAGAAEELQTFKAGFFKALAHPARIRILEVLVRGERSVQELQARLKLGQSVVSQQLSVLRANGIVVSRKQGVSVHYAVRDPLMSELLLVARRIFDNRLAGHRHLLRHLREERPSTSARRVTGI